MPFRLTQWVRVALDCAVDTSTPTGEAMANMLGTFSQFERRLIGQRIRKSTRSDGAYRLGSAELTRGNPPEPGLT
jgi:DNA invertase Pin-like site-specific DNA recombinase